MSISYSSEVVCGFFVDIISKTESKQKFNEDTGEPYQVDIPSYEVAMVNGIEIGSTENNPDAFCNGEKLDGLEFGSSGYDNYGKKWFGKVVASASERVGDLNIFEVSIPNEVQLFVDNYGLNPTWFVSLSCG